MRRVLTRQLDIARKLAGYHLDGLTAEECLWRPAIHGLHVHRGSDGKWRADWPNHQGYDLGPPACYLPARRVLGIEPARSLRDE